MLKAGVGDLGAAEHSGYLVRARAVVEYADLGLGAAVIFALFDDEMLACEGRYLRQMRDAEHLLTFRERLQFLAHCFSRPSTKADVNLMEDQRSRGLALRL